MTDPLARALAELTPVLAALGIRYIVIGSLASSTRGIYRATQDGDLLALIAPGQGAKLAASLGSNFYADPEMIDSAIRQRRAFNVIHIPMAQKIDIFPATSDFHMVEMGRAVTASVFPGEDAILLPVASAEDTVAKLLWYREGGEVSEKQWGDITGVLATNRNLDFDYLRPWAIRLRVSDLLKRRSPKWSGNVKRSL